MKRESGFTFLEVLLAIGLLAILSFGVFAILEDIGGGSIREASRAEVQRNLRFSLETISRLIREASYIETASGSTLVLRTQSPSKDPTTIILSGGAITVQEGSAESPQAITGNRVNVEGLTFTLVRTPGARDAVDLTLAISYKAGSNQEAVFSQTLSSLIARASAAVFDSDLLPGTDNTYSLGLNPIPRWLDGAFSRNVVVGNNLTVDTNTLVVDATANRVGIGTVSPADTLDVSGTLRVSGNATFSGSATFSGTATFNSNVGVGTASPNSLLEVASSGYFQISKQSSGPPPAGDCDTDAERGRLVLSTNNRLYVCNGSGRGWDYIDLTN